MPLLTNVGKARRGHKALRLLFYGLLLGGAAGVVFPLLIVLGQTLSDRFDLRDNAIVPRYLFDDNELLLKHIFNDYPQATALLASRHNRDAWSTQAGMRDDAAFLATREEAYRAQGLSLAGADAVVRDLDGFVGTLSPDDLLVRMFGVEDAYRAFLEETYGKKADELMALAREGKDVPKWLARRFPNEAKREKLLRDKAELTLAVLNEELQTNYSNLYMVELLPEKNYLVPFWRAGNEPKESMWRAFKASLPPERKMIVPTDAYWHAYLKSTYRVITNLNEAWGSGYAGFYSVRMPSSRPEAGAVRKDWDAFVQKRWPRRLLEISGAYDALWQTEVKRRLTARLGHAAEDAEKQALRMASELAGKELDDWSELRCPARYPEDPTLGLYWCEFTASGKVALEDLRLLRPEEAFTAYLREAYRGDLAKLNAAWRASYDSFAAAPLPLAFADYAQVKRHAGALRASFATESYRRVWGYLFSRGRAVWNTLILVTLSLLSALTINPMAAYALSRFPMRNTPKILLFFLATMAFPAEVAMIPNFLLLRDLGLLNTYAALILPGMANGYAIFLLKGFFDSLPQELYQAAEIDGATEFQVFRLVAVPLVTPILAYIGLGAFVTAYGGFMWALVICPQPEMWTLMVWIYDFQMSAPGNNYVMAATALVSLPPLAVFLVANKIIMKGIVIPSMK